MLENFSANVPAGALLIGISFAMVTNYVKEMITTSSQMIIHWSDAIIVAILKKKYRIVVLIHQSSCAKIKSWKLFSATLKNSFKNYQGR